MEENKEDVAPEGLIRLISGDGFTFTIEAKYAMVSSVIQTMMNSSFKESRTRVINLPHVKGRVLERICQYFYYVPRFQNRDGTGGAYRATNAGDNSPLIYSFVEVFDIPPELSLEIYLCARYLEM